MPQEELPDILAGIVVAAAFLAGLWVAYRQGFRAALPVRSREFDFLEAGLALHDSRWLLEGEATDRPNPGASVLPVLHLQQAGSRVTGTGRRADGTAWQVEGIVQGRQINCLTLGWEAGQPEPGMLMLRAAPDGRSFKGYRIAWDRQGALLSLREVSLARTAATSEPATGLPGNAWTNVP